jgi:hypothetical protein
MTICKFETTDFQYIAGTLSQRWAPGQILLKTPTLLSTAEVALQITDITGRTATAILAGLLRNIGYAGALPYAL